MYYWAGIAVDIVNCEFYAAPESMYRDEKLDRNYENCIVNRKFGGWISSTTNYGKNGVCRNFWR